MSGNMLPVPLDPLSFGLRGSRLIEASAGTGKTYTIAALYLRLVLGHGGAAGFHRPLVPPEILVVTFTEAATKELRDRIRARLAEAADAFLRQPGAPGPDDTQDALLRELRAAYPPAQWPLQARTLRLAAEWMDESAVSTIHGWCLRMLREHAFDSGSLFTQQLEADQRELRAEAVRDYWRIHFTPLSPADARRVRDWWAGPEPLLDQVERLLPVADALGPGLPPAQALASAQSETVRVLAELKRPWAGADGWVADLRVKLDAAVAAKTIKMPARKAWMDCIAAWAQGDAALPALTPNAWTRLTPEGLANDGKCDTELLAHPAWAALAALRAAAAALPDGRDDLLAHAVRWVGQRLAAEQARLAQMGFNELLTRLDAALQGPNGPALAARIRGQFPVALIDEFQDTDPVQYRIFDAIYRVRSNDPQTALVLIGDPKQAIYAFRGADIHTYLAARRDTGERHATLGTNFRSTTSMVEAVNALFGQAESRPRGQGAFLFRQGADNPVPFQPVQAHGRAQYWQAGGQPGAALTFWTLPDESATKGLAQRALSAACASEIVRLLRAGQEGQAGFVDDAAGTLRAVQPGDIAVLVNTGHEAVAVREALAARGVRSVYLSDNESVYQSVGAADLQRWLAACAQPQDDRLLRAALGTATLGLPLAELDRLNHDELAWEARVNQFRDYRQMWRRQGVLPMLRHLLHDFQVAHRLIARGDERLLTDLLHLAELLQQASARLEGEHGLIRYLAEQRQDEGQGDDARKLRLESDLALVKVVTVHKSKGLEYPLVFLPFGTSFRPAEPGDLPLKWHDEQGRLHLSLRRDEAAAQRADQERLGEDLRKLYVALTRARFATWVGAAPIPQVERSALGYLVSGGAALAPAALAQALAQLAAVHAGIAVRPAPEPSDEHYTQAETAAAPAPQPPLPAGGRPPWWIASYSALRIEGQGDAGADDEVPQDTLPQALLASPATSAEHSFLDSRETAPAPRDRDAALAAAAGGLHGFARGARPGTFLHGLLEWAGRLGFGQALARKDELQRQVALRCQRDGWGPWAGAVQDWLARWLATPLDLQALVPGIRPVAPAELRQVQVEMEFWFAADRVNAATLDRLVRAHTLQGQARPALSPLQINGMLKGFIDLVFEHEGRYFVADYKSNWLGPRDADYTPQAMRQAILDNRYELQYVLYVFALHRLLRARLPDYDYERHVGGAVYIFLRGSAAPGQGLHCERPPAALIEALDRLFSGEPRAAQATP